MEIKDSKHFLIPGAALLELRYFEKAMAHKHIFALKTYLKEGVSKELESASWNETPHSMKTNEYISLTELKPVIGEGKYNEILIDLLSRSTNFDQVNVIFPFIVKCENLTKEQVNFITTYSLERSVIKRSFEAQTLMLGFIERNKRNIEWSLFRRVLKEFPHSNLGGILV